MTVDQMSVEKVAIGKMTIAKCWTTLGATISDSFGSLSTGDFFG